MWTSLIWSVESLHGERLTSSEEEESPPAGCLCTWAPLSVFLACSAEFRIAKTSWCLGHFLLVFFLWRALTNTYGDCVVYCLHWDTFLLTINPISYFLSHLLAHKMHILVLSPIPVKSFAALSPVPGPSCRIMLSMQFLCLLIFFNWEHFLAFLCLQASDVVEHQRPFHSFWTPWDLPSLSSRPGSGLHLHSAFCMVMLYPFDLIPSGDTVSTCPSLPRLIFIT